MHCSKSICPRQIDFSEMCYAPSKALLNKPKKILIQAQLSELCPYQSDNVNHL